ncbi:prefoldin subunit alpha [Candidatus Woesearchaeota archaeon]|nr:prefoldin subunit alpha [Candidatus Woesearchaeota archaeon]
MANAKNNEIEKPAKEKAKEISSSQNKKDELLKDKYAELRLASVQIKQLQQQLEALDEKRQELGNAITSLDELKGSQKKAKMLAPVTEGMFISATLDSSEELIVNVGGNVCVRKTVEEAKGMLKEKQQEISGYQESMLEELNKLTDQAAGLEAELGQMLQDKE